MLSTLLHTPETWVILSLILFFGLLVRFGAFRMIGAYLDTHAKRIADRIQEAENLSDEAEKELEKCAHQLLEAEQARKSILERARKDAELSTKMALDAVEATLKRRVAAAEERIAQAELAARREIRNEAIGIAVAVTAETVDAHLTEAARGALVHHGIETVRARFHELENA